MKWIYERFTTNLTVINTTDEGQTFTKHGTLDLTPFKADPRRDPLTSI